MVDGFPRCTETCQDRCVPEGSTRCSGLLIQTCLAADGDCLDWLTTGECSPDEACDDSVEPARCVCTDTCQVEGATRCNGDIIEACALRGDGCLDWVAEQDCTAEGLVCADRPGGALCEACVPDCSGRECGPDPVCGASCGMCTGATEMCREGTGQCEDVCEDRECGTVEGIDCGTCEGETEICREAMGFCDDVCEGRECGEVEGIDCGVCLGLTDRCRQEDGICVDVCAGVECGLVEGIFCGQCPEGEECMSGICYGVECEGGMCPVPAGTFWMGCNSEVDSFCEDDEVPYHEVYLDAYEIDRYEVTQAAYYECIVDHECDFPDLYFDPEMHGDFPVVGVDSEQARNYCAWAGKRLCTEAEWEKAARGTDGRRYPWGNDPADCDHAVMAGCAGDSFAPVGSKPAGESPYGLLDMAGNAWEWVNDYYDAHFYHDCIDECVNPTGAFGGTRVIRGGDALSWPRQLRVSERATSHSFEESLLGFRCCR